MLQYEQYAGMVQQGVRTKYLYILSRLLIVSVVCLPRLCLIVGLVKLDTLLTVLFALAICELSSVSQSFN